ncbi:hypothetical protein [uncultured Anaerococcus sp.]|uniref:hypothetical protein n=1 Tax=uncultured Anaerococcus sp. TaxID=293428 RepID=UPI00288927F4|nr:hypothetical protein [uncultured Anaerococcus sp.]
MKKSFNVFVKAALVFGLALGMTACGKSKADVEVGSDNLISFEETEKDFVDSAKNLDWPEGYEIPDHLDDDKDATFEAGFGNTRASQYWEAAWQEEWLNNYKTNPEKAEEAIKELEKAPGMAYMGPDKCDDATRKAFKDSLEKAKDGDPSGFEENLKLNDPR